MSNRELQESIWDLIKNVRAVFNIEPHPTKKMVDQVNELAEEYLNSTLFIIPHYDAGGPTCSLNVEKKEYCSFLRVRNLGQTPHCAFTSEDLVSDTHIRPCSGCPRRDI